MVDEKLEAMEAILEQFENQEINEKSNLEGEYSPELIEFAEAIGKHPSEIPIMNSPSNNKSKSSIPHVSFNIKDETLREQNILEDRGFKGLDEGTAQEIHRNLFYVKEKLGVDFSLREVSSEQVLSTIRSDDEVSHIENLVNFSESSDFIKLEENIMKIPKPEEFNFGKDLESTQYEITHCPFDTEADKFSETIAFQGFNLETRRTVLGVVSDSYNFQEYIQPDGSTFIYVETPNINDCVLLMDIETVIAAIMISALAQGHKHLSSLMGQLRKQKLPSFNYQILEDILFDKRRTNYIPHNGKYDVEKLKKADRDNKKRLYALRNIRAETITIRSYESRRQKGEDVEDWTEELYFYHLGNIQAGFRYGLSAYKQGINKITKIKITPNQADSHPLTFLTDTLIAAVALQAKGVDKEGKSGYGLAALSNGCKYEKLDLEDEKKIFSPEDFRNPIEHGLNNPIEYGLNDVYATLCVYEKLTNLFTWEDINHILNINSKGTEYPFLSKITSTASVAKHILFFYLESNAGISKKMIEQNVEIQRQFQDNFIRTYLGGKVEAFVQGLVKSTKNQQIYYLDYASLYPHVAWLIEADMLYKLAVRNKLHKVIKDDKVEAWNRIEKSCKEWITGIKNKQPFSKDTFRRLNGNISVFSKIKLQLPGRLKEKGDRKPKRTEIKKYGAITCTIQDLAIAIVREYFDSGKSLASILRKIRVRRAEYIDLSDEKSTEYGEDFFTSLYQNRSEIKEEKWIIEHDQIEERSDEIRDRTHKKLENQTIDLVINSLKGQEQLLKFIMNSSYGISAEGVSMDDHTGVLFVPAIASGITATARSLTSLAEIAAKQYQALPLYTDTDSIQIRSSKQQKLDICNLFSKVDKLKDELGKEEDPSYDPISQLYIASKKSYGYIKESGKLNINIHGRGQYEKEEFVNSLEKYYKLLFTTKYSEQNYSKFADITKNIHSIEEFIGLDTKSSSRYKGLKYYFNKHARIIYAMEWEGVPLIFRYNYKRDSLLITNIKDLHLGLFGKYLNVTRGKQKHTMKIFIAAPIENFDEMCKWIVDELYVPGSDKIFNMKKVKESKWLEFEKIVKDMINQHIRNEASREYAEFGMIDSAWDIDVIEDWKYYFSKLCRSYEIDFKEFKTTEGLVLVDRIMSYGKIKHLEKTIYSLSDKQTKNLIDTIGRFSENDEQYLKHSFLKKDYEIYQIYYNIVDKISNADKQSPLHVYNYLKNKQKFAHFKGFEHLLFKLSNLVNLRLRVKNKMQNYFTLDSRALKRRKTGEKETFNVMEVHESDEKCNEKVIFNYSKRLNEKILTDGMGFHFKIPVANLQFSNELKANLDRYYTANIINTSIAATKIYHATHGETPECLYLGENAVGQHDPECRSPSCPIIQAIYTKTTNRIAPKRGQVIVVPISMKIVPEVNARDQIINGEWINPKYMKKLLDKNIVRKRGEIYEIQDMKKYHTWEIKYLEKRNWQEINLWGHNWIVCIEKYNSSNFNATININILPEKNNYFTYRSITASMHLNPLSFDLKNLNLFETTISQSLDNVHELKKLIKPLFKDKDLSYFDRNQSLTKEDMIEKGLKEVENQEERHFKEYRKIFYTWLAKQVIIENLDKTQCRLTQLSISEQKKFKSRDRALAISLLTNSVQKRYKSNMPDEVSDYLKFKDDLQVYPHKSSHGVSMSNTKAKCSVSIYAKDKKMWLMNKTIRIAGKRKLTKAQVRKILDTDMDENTVRYETALFGLEQIIKVPTSKILNYTEKFIDKAFKLADTVNNDYEDQILDLDRNTPSYYYDVDTDFDKMPENTDDWDPPPLNY